MGRIKRRGRRWLNFALFLLILIFSVLLLTVRIQSVQVSGNTRYSKEQIESMIFDTNFSRNPAYCYYQYRFMPHKQIPFVEDYKLIFKSPARVEIIVYEKSIVGYVSFMNSLMYFDKDGIIVESTSEKLEGIPMITGLKFNHIVLHRPLPVEDSEIFEEILNLTQLLAVYHIEVDEIHYNSSREASLTINNLVVELGNNRQINGKISELNDILKDYSELDGTLYLDVYDETNSNPMYRFQKDSEQE